MSSIASGNQIQNAESGARPELSVVLCLQDHWILLVAARLKSCPCL